MLHSIGLYQICIDGEPFAKFTQLYVAKRFQKHLENKGYKNVCIYILVDE